ncbi:MAG: hypothetical protein Q8R82_04375 [Hyphomonadaceae bacterium]|nr:hypothetical protein [Hyphomonadaceae bacterium]
MFHRIALLAAAGVMATACASSPSSSGGGMVADAGGAVSLTGATPAGTVTVANMAATTAWAAEDNLIPQDPVLALVTATNGNTDNPQGVLISCNASNGGTTVKVGKQPANRVGQSATYRIRTGASAQEVEGKFQASKSGDADFVFPIRQSDLLAMSKLDTFSILSDTGEVQWAFVKDPAAQVQAKYIASLKNMPKQTEDFMVFCNPK